MAAAAPQAEERALDTTATFSSLLDDEDEEFEEGEWEEGAESDVDETLLVRPARRARAPVRIKPHACACATPPHPACSQQAARGTGGALACHPLIQPPALAAPGLPPAARRLVPRVPFSKPRPRSRPANRPPPDPPNPPDPNGQTPPPGVQPGPLR